MALKKQLEKAYKEYEQSSNQYPAQALYNSVQLEQQPVLDEQQLETKIKPANRQQSSQPLRNKPDPFKKAMAKYESAKLEREQKRTERAKQQARYEKTLKQQKQKRNESKRLHLAKTQKGQPKLGDQVTALLDKIKPKH